MKDLLTGWCKKIELTDVSRSSLCHESLELKSIALLFESAMIFAKQNMSKYGY